LDILSGEEGVAVSFKKTIRIQKQRIQIKIFLWVLFFIYSQYAYSECMRVDPNLNGLEEFSQEDILKEARQYHSAEEIADIIDFGKEMNSMIPQLNSNWRNHKSGISVDGIDLNTIVERYSSPAENQKITQFEPKLFVFVSNSMPEESLKQWSQQVERMGGTLVLRGFIDNSPKKTVERVMELFGKEETSGFSIDPELFEQLSINKVPAVAIVLPQDKPCEEHDCPKPRFEVVYGDVPLDEALFIIANRNSDNVCGAVKEILVRYGKKL
jgi:type-F conjugative transfer system pilin assembly protein TrbC